MAASRPRVGNILAAEWPQPIPFSSDKQLNTLILSDFDASDPTPLSFDPIGPRLSGPRQSEVLIRKVFQIRHGWRLWRSRYRCRSILHIASSKPNVNPTIRTPIIFVATRHNPPRPRPAGSSRRGAAGGREYRAADVADVDFPLAERNIDAVGPEEVGAEQHAGFFDRLGGNV